ncbi:MAG: glycosyltransferase family 39 protein [Myxococcales bacterium]|nr:glycosyltransferase family 39 protein [Myxococcales bacterium]
MNERPHLGPLARGAVLALALAPRLWAAFADQGLFWPDEFFQSLEQAHRFAFGYGIVPWEFAEGARSWLFPGLIGLLWKFLSALGVKSAVTLVVAAKLAMVAASVVTAELAMRLALRMAGPRAAILAGTWVALFPATVLFGSKCMTETVSAPLLLAGALLSHRSASDRDAVSWRRLATAGALAGVAVFFRYQNGLVVVGLAGVLFAERRFRDAGAFAAGAAIAGLAGGMLDYVTWGRPFYSFVQYARFHAETGGASWGALPFGYYWQTTWRSGGVVMLVVLAGLTLAWRSWGRYVALVGVYFLVHSAVPHKEYRYLLPPVPLALTVAAAGLSMALPVCAAWVTGRWPSLARRPVAAALAVALVVLSVAGFGERAAFMTFGDLGHEDGLAAGLAFDNDSPWHAAEGINRLLWAAGAADDTCGVVLKDIPWSSTGGFAYLHRDVPLLFAFSPRNLRSANVLIARREFQQPKDYREGPESRGFMLFRRDGPCEPPPHEYTRIVPP